MTNSLDSFSIRPLTTTACDGRTFTGSGFLARGAAAGVTVFGLFMGDMIIAEVY